MAAAIIMLEQARRARDRAARLRAVARGINVQDAVEKIEAMVRHLDQTADQLEKSALEATRRVERTGDLASEIKATIAYSKELVRRSRRILDPGNED